MSMSVGSGGDDGGGGAMCDINTTPLIDILLVLLVTLIVTLPVEMNAVKLDMPPPSNAPPPPVQPQVLNLDIYYDGTIALNGTTVTLPQLSADFKYYSTQKPQPEVHLSPDPHVKYNTVALVMASAQRNHMEKIGFVNTAQFANF